MSKNRVKLNILGTEFTVLSDESESYVMSIAAEVNDKMGEAQKGNINMSMLTSAILTCMDFCDQIRKAKEISEDLRKRNSENYEVATKSQALISGLKASNEELKIRVHDLEGKLESLKIRSNEVIRSISATREGEKPKDSSKKNSSKQNQTSESISYQKDRDVYRQEAPREGPQQSGPMDSSNYREENSHAPGKYERVIGYVIGSNEGGIGEGYIVGENNVGSLGQGINKGERKMSEYIADEDVYEKLDNESRGWENGEYNDVLDPEDQAVRRIEIVQSNEVDR